MGKYKTKSRSQLIEYFKSQVGIHLAIYEIHEYFQYAKKPIGLTTIYRQLENLVDEGLVVKHIDTLSEGAKYEYVGKGDICHKSDCYHFKCTECGTLEHLQCHTLGNLGTHMINNHGFVVDPFKTIFYGKCEKCNRKRKED